MKEIESGPEMKEKVDRRLTISEISIIMSKPWTWVIRHLVPFRDLLEIPEGGKMRQVKVPSEILPLLSTVERISVRASGDMITIKRIERELGVDSEWVHRRILFLKTKGEFLISNDKVPQVHLYFHRDAIREMKKIMGGVSAIPEDEYLNMTELSRKLKRHPLWVHNRLKNLSVESKLGLDKMKKVVEFYPKDVLVYLQAEKDKYKESEGFLTIQQLANGVGKDREWVVRRLEKMEVGCELRRFPKSGRVDICFAPEVLTELQKLAEQYKFPKNGWYTENAIVGMTGKSSNWVRRRLKYLNGRVRQGRDKMGSLRRYYPARVVEKLIDEARGWQPSYALDGTEGGRCDNLDKFVQIINSSGITTSKNSLNKKGATDEEIQAWRNRGLLTRWHNGQYLFTKEAQEITFRVAEADKATEAIRKLKQMWEEEGDRGDDTGAIKGTTKYRDV